MSEMQLRMEAESGSPKELPEVQDTARCSPEGVVYKLCKRGHVRSPDNVDKNKSCKKCQQIRQQTPDVKAKRKLYQETLRQTPEYKSYQKAYKKAYEQTPQRKAYRRSTKRKAYNKEYQKEWQKIPERKEKLKLARKLRTNDLSDLYVVSALKVPAAQVTPELLELKRMMIKLHRAKRAYLEGVRHEKNEQDGCTQERS